MRLDPALLLDRCPYGLNGLAADEQGVDSNDGDASRSVIEHGRPDLAWVMERPMVGLAIAARLLHAGRR
ncbi:MAG: hypothetical protein ABSH35_18335 [Isosphaeraceae bacterium]